MGKYIDLSNTLRKRLTALGHSYTVDDSGATIGKRYSRNDELGIPFAMTVDFDSIKDGTVTLRERDSMEQVRLPSEEVARVVHDIVSGRRTWNSVQSSYT